MSTIDVAALGFGLAVGHASDHAGATGCTVVRGIDAPLRASACILGRATGTREVALLAPEASNERIDAILLTGGSAYGLDAAAGVMRWMEAHGRGYPIAGGVVPIVPAAVVFDLAPLGRFDARPTADMAWQACDTATSSDIAEGNVGVGTGCTVGKVLGPTHAMKGGVGIAVHEGGNRVRAFAIAGVNAIGHVRALDGDIIAGPRGADGAVLDAEAVLRAGGAAPRAEPAANTTIAVVGLNVSVSKTQLFQVARAATAALYRQIGPAGTTADGDVVFAVCPLEGPTAPLMQLEACAVAALSAAIVRAVTTAQGRDGLPGLAD